VESSVRRIVYLSTATRLMSDVELMDVLRVSRENNTRDGVTGLLLYQGGNFIQLLEGEAAAVDAVYARVMKDPRHHSVLRMLDNESPERLFPDWSMAFRPAASLGDELKQEIADFIIRAPQEAATTDGRRALRLISSFVQSMR
jgi:hypothetical protein